MREWHDKGWGVIDSPDTPGGCWAHLSILKMDGYRSLRAGEAVDLEWERGWQTGTTSARSASSLARRGDELRHTATRQVSLPPSEAPDPARLTRRQLAWGSPRLPHP